MPAPGLSDDQVAGELNKMVEFIKKEADEKAKEIQLKADEEYEIEKANLVRSETANIDTLYETKFKKASLAQQISKSTIANKTRLKILGSRDEVLQNIISEAESKLHGISNDQKVYKDVLKGLALEGLYTLLENKTSFKVRKQDVDLIKSLLSDVTKEYDEHVNKESSNKIEISISDDYLPADSAGGLIAVNQTGKIEVDNTLETRLQLLKENSLPAIRLVLFGVSTSRKFFD